MKTNKGSIIMKYFNCESMHHWCKQILQSYNMNADDADTVANVLLEADMRKIYSHGISGGSGLDDIIQKIKSGGINLNYQFNMYDKNAYKYKTIACLDADGGPGHSLSVKCVNLVKKMAKTYGNAIVYLYNSTHFGAAGIYSELIAKEKDLIGKVYTITPEWMIPYNAHDNVKCIGTNPIAWSTPYNDGIVTIDIAMTQRAASVALNAAKTNQISKKKVRIPSNYLVDQNKQEILCPQNCDLVKRGSLLPLGGNQYGYKGYGMALSIELNHLIGGSTLKTIPVGCKTSDGRVAHIFEAQAVDCFSTVQEALDKVTCKIQKIKNIGGTIPGENEAIAREKSIRQGVCYNDDQLKRLIAIGESAGIRFITHEGE